MGSRSRFRNELSGVSACRAEQSTVPSLDGLHLGSCFGRTFHFLRQFFLFVGQSQRLRQSAGWFCSPFAYQQFHRRHYAWSSNAAGGGNQSHRAGSAFVEEVPFCGEFRRQYDFRFQRCRRWNADSQRHSDARRFWPARDGAGSAGAVSAGDQHRFQRRFGVFGGFGDGRARCGGIACLCEQWTDGDSLHALG